MSGKRITLEDLTAMVQRGVLEQREQNKAEHKAMRTELSVIRGQNTAEHKEIRNQLGEMVTRNEHEQLKTRVRVLETATV